MKNLSDNFKIALVQPTMSTCPDDNISSTIDAIASAGEKGAKIICLAELFRTRYFCQMEDTQMFDLAESIPGPTTDAISIAAKNAGVVVIASIFERRAAGVYHNTAVIIGPDGEIIGTYRKMHIPDDPGYYEKFYFAPGDLPFRAFDTPFGKIAVLICWDQWFPEAARAVTLDGAEIIFYPTAIGWHPSEKEQFGLDQHDAWKTVQRASAIANGVYVAAVNRTGYEPAADKDGIEFWGGSFVADPFGKVISEASHEGREIIFAEIDRGRIEQVRRDWPFLRDRRPDAYGQLGGRFNNGG